MTQPEPSPLTTQLRLAAIGMHTQLGQLDQVIADIESMLASAEQRIAMAERKQHAAERQAQLTEEKRRQQVSASPKLLTAAAAFLLKVEGMTTEQFSMGEDRVECAELRAILEDLDVIESRELQPQSEEV